MDLSKLPTRFWDHVQPCPITGCWNWTDKTISGGYSRFSAQINGSREYYAHRVTYKILVGDVRRPFVLDHLCRNRECCNPLHVERVSQRTNLMRGVGVIAKANSEKTHCDHHHPLSGWNLRIYTRKNGYVDRVCRECERIRGWKQRERKFKHAA